MTYIVDNTCLYFFHFATAEESVSGFGRSAGNQRVCKRSLVYNLRQCRPFGCFTFRFRESQMPNFPTPTFRGCKEMGWEDMRADSIFIYFTSQPLLVSSATSSISRFLILTAVSQHGELSGALRSKSHRATQVARHGGEEKSSRGIFQQSACGMVLQYVL